MTETEFHALIESESGDRVVAAFKGKSESERRHLAPPAIAEWESEDGRNLPRWYAIAAAVAATASLSELRRWQFVGVFHGPYLRQILEDRRPPWIQELAAHLCKTSPHFIGPVHQLIDAGLCDPPDTEAYIIGLITLRVEPAALRTLPRFLERDVWRLLATEGTSDCSLTKWGGHWWVVLRQLIEDGDLPRDRVLDASLAALGADFVAFRARWFAVFHDFLEPTAAEMLARRDHYLGLLDNPTPATVKFALAHLRTLQKRDELPASDLLDAIAPVLRSKTKAMVKRGFAVLAAIAGDPRAPVVAAIALEHESPAVQELAMKFLTKHAPPPGSAVLRSRLQELRDEVAPSMRQRLDPWVGPLENSSPHCDFDVDDLLERATSPELEPWVNAVRNSELPPSREPFVPGLRLTNPVAPILDLEELIREASRALEEPRDAMLMERVLDGVSRLCDQRLDDFEVRTGPLRQRAENVRRLSDSPVPRVILSWLLGKKHWRRLKNAEVATRALWGRFRPLCVRASQRSAQALLSMPTHEPGWIDVEVLRQRLEQVAEPDPADLYVAMMRVAPAGAEAFFSSRGVARPVVESVEKDWDVEVSWLATLWPGGNQALFQQGAAAMEDAMYSTEYTRGVEAWMDPLFHRDVPLGGGGRELIACALGARPTDVSAVAVDLLVAAIEDGRLDGMQLGETLRATVFRRKELYRVLTTPPILRKKEIYRVLTTPPGRYAKTLSTAGSVSVLHALVIRQALEIALREKPRGINTLLELLLELCIDFGAAITDPECRTFLAGFSGSSKSARAARRLLALEETDRAEPSRQAAALHALAAQLDLG